MIRLPKSAVAVFVAAALAGSARAQDSTAVAAGKTFVTGQQKTITRVMHPTAKLMTVDPVTVSATASGYTLVVTYRFKGAIGEQFYSRMEYAFDAGGRFGAINTQTTTSIVKPFTAANAGLAVVREAVAKELEVKDNSVAKMVMKSVDARDALNPYLKMKQPAR